MYLLSQPISNLSNEGSSKSNPEGYFLTSFLHTQDQSGRFPIEYWQTEALALSSERR